MSSGLAKPLQLTSSSPFFYLYLHRIRRRVERDPRPYMDVALTPAASEMALPRASRPGRKATAEAIA